MASLWPPDPAHVPGQSGRGEVHERVELRRMVTPHEEGRNRLQGPHVVQLPTRAECYDKGGRVRMNDRRIRTMRRTSPFQRKRI